MDIMFSIGGTFTELVVMAMSDYVQQDLFESGYIIPIFILLAVYFF